MSNVYLKSTVPVVVESVDRVLIDLSMTEARRLQALLLDYEDCNRPDYSYSPLWMQLSEKGVHGKREMSPDGEYRITET